MPLLQLESWPEVERYLRHSTGIVVPIGSTEQHGPNGVIGTDALCSQAVCAHAAQRAHMMVAPVLPYGPAQFNMDFPGTISIRSSTLMAVVEDIVASLLRHGFRQIYFLNGHGANVAPIRAAFHDLHATFEHLAPRLRLKSWWELEPVGTMRATMFGDREGLHATPSEVAMVQSAHPEAIRPQFDFDVAILDAAAIRDMGGDNHSNASSHRRTYPDGRVGSDPNMANADLGAQLLDAAATGLATDYAKWLA